MYSDIVQDHVARPRNVGPLETATHQGVAGVPGDGPYLILWLQIEDRQILRATYATYGCPAAVACGSMTAAVITGRSIEKASLLTAEDLVRLLGGLPEGREHCPRLAIQALTRALQGDPL